MNYAPYILYYVDEDGFYTYLSNIDTLETTEFPDDAYRFNEFPNTEPIMYIDGHPRELKVERYVLF